MNLSELISLTIKQGKQIHILKGCTEGEIKSHVQISYPSASAQMSNKEQLSLIFTGNRGSEVKQTAEGLTTTKSDISPGLLFPSLAHPTVCLEISI